MQTAPYLSDAADGPDGGQAVWITARDGVRIRLGLFQAEDARGTVVLCPGRTEYIEKYGRTATDLVARGYSVVVIDWRGQGLADRLMDDPLIGHVKRFSDYQLDIDAVLETVRALQLPTPWHMIAHSMGGAIGLRALMRQLPFTSAVFTGPMWGIQMSPLIRPFAGPISWGFSALGLGERLTPGTKPAAYVLNEPFQDNLLTRDRDMFDYMKQQLLAEPGLQLGGPSVTWLREALQETAAMATEASPDLPCLTFMGTDEAIVERGSILNRMQRWPAGRLELIEGGRHEVLMEDRALRTRLADQIVAHFDAAVAEAHPLAAQ